MTDMSPPSSNSPVAAFEPGDRSVHAPAPGGFLRPEDLPMISHHLRGVQQIEVRQIGGPAAAGAEVVALLEAAGLQVSFRRLERMTPPPRCRLVFRYPGARAELTIAPELED